MADALAWALIVWLGIGNNYTIIHERFETRELCEVAGNAIFDKPKYRGGQYRNPEGNYICVQRRWRDQ